MDYDNPQFIAAVKKVLQQHLAQLSDSIDDLKETVSAHWQSEEKRYQTKPITISDLRANVPIPIKNETKNTVPKWIWIIFKGTLEVLGIAAAVVYAGVAFNQWQETIDATNLTAKQTELSRKALNESIKNFRQDERAWVIPSIPPGQNATKDRTHLMTSDFVVINTGKTEAKNVRASVMITTVKKNGRLSFDLTWAWPVAPGFLGPNMPRHYGVPITQPLADGSHGGITWGEIEERVNHGDLYIFGFGKVTYRDVFSEHMHTVRFCNFLEGGFAQETFTMPGLMKQCDSYNQGEDKEAD